MIEHFEKFKLTPLSFSHLNEFAFYRARWALRKIFKYDFTVGPAAERGTVIETGLNMWFNGRDLAEIEKKIIDQYLYNTRHVEKIKRDKEGDVKKVTQKKVTKSPEGKKVRVSKTKLTREGKKDKVMQVSSKKKTTKHSYEGKSKRKYGPTTITKSM